MLTRFVGTALLILLLTACSNWSDAAVAETKRRGDVICRAIESYRGRHGRVPSSLSELQPEFLSQIPEPTVGKKRWEYASYENGQAYNLEVAIQRYSEPLLQTQSEGGWSYDTK